MGYEIRSALRPALVLLLLFALVTGLAYPLAITGVAQLVFPRRANGSLVADDAGRIVGSALIGQRFASPRYFHGRPSAAGDKGYDARNSSGSNLGPASKALADRIRRDVAALRAGGVAGPIPADLVTASASGLDPDISPAAARVQVARVAAARGMPVALLFELIDHATRRPALGLPGEPRVNVLLLNRQLDRLSATIAR